MRSGGISTSSLHTDPPKSLYKNGSPSVLLRELKFSIYDSSRSVGRVGYQVMQAVPVQSTNETNHRTVQGIGFSMEGLKKDAMLLAISGATMHSTVASSN